MHGIDVFIKYMYSQANFDGMSTNDYRASNKKIWFWL